MLYSLGVDYQSATLVNTIQTGVNVNAMSFEISADSKYIYYVTTDQTDGYQLKRFAINSSTTQNMAAIGKPASIARAKNNNLYVSASGNTTLTETNFL